MAEGIYLKLTEDHPKVVKLARLVGCREDRAYLFTIRWFMWVGTKCRSDQTEIDETRFNRVTGWQMPGESSRDASRKTLAAAMSELGWVDIDAAGLIRVLEYDKYLSDEGRRRCLTRERVAKIRNASCVLRGEAGQKKGITWELASGWGGVSDQDRENWRNAYPACDIDRQLAAMHSWLVANPAKAKKSRWLRFITNWLSRSQDRGGDGVMDQPKPRRTREERDALYDGMGDD